MINKPVVLVVCGTHFQCGKINIAYVDAFYFRKKVFAAQAPISVHAYFPNGDVESCKIEFETMRALFSRDVKELKDDNRDNAILVAEWFADGTIIRIDWPAVRLRKSILERWWKLLSQGTPYWRQLDAAKKKMNMLLPDMIANVEKAKKRALTGAEMQRLRAQANAQTTDKIWEEIHGLPLPDRIDFRAPRPDIESLKKKVA